MIRRFRRFPNKKQIKQAEMVLRQFAPDILRRWREAITLPGGFNQHDMKRHGIKQYVKATSGSAYNLDRLKRVKPQLYQKVLSGELSIYSAALGAGFIKQRPSPFEQVEKLIQRQLKKLTDK